MKTENSILNILKNRGIKEAPELTTTLDLSGLKLKSIPTDISLLKNLQALKLNQNQLTTIPKELGTLNNLQFLDLSHNQLTTIPKELSALNNLLVLDLDENPIEFPPPEIVNQGSKSILNYLRSIKKERFEAKLIILGDGDEGKTCVSRALRGLEFEEQVTTHGVDVQPWTFAHPKFSDNKEKDITLRIWDFEGQEICHQSHQFFLTRRSLYMFVFKGRDKFRIDRLEYWLDTIRAKASGCKVILVATECEKRTPVVPSDRIKDKYGDMFIHNEFLFAVGCSDNKGIKALQEELQNEAAKLYFMGQPWPVTYSRAEDAIKKETRNFITRDELYEIFKNSEIEKKEFESLSRVFGDMGVITHFPDCVELNDFIVLDPQWLTKAISLCLESKELADNRGEFTHKWLQDLWEKDYKGLFPKFYQCMKEFELCYALEDVKGTSLAPLRFSYEKPGIPWSDLSNSKERRCEYRFDSTPPAGIISRLIVKTHHMITKPEENPKGVYWRNGMFLKSGDGDMRSEALCEYDEENRKLTVTVRAAFPQNMLEQLNGFINAVFSFFDGIKPKRYYGCVKDKEESCDGLHNEELIAFALAKKERKTVDCTIGLHEADALSIVSGFSSFGESKGMKEELKQGLQTVKLNKPEWRDDIGFGRDIHDLDARANFIVESSEKQLEAANIQMSQLTLRDFFYYFDKILDAREFYSAPGIIAILPIDSKSWNPKEWFNQTYMLSPYCEHEGGIHRIDFSVKFTKPRTWWAKSGPVLNVIIQTSMRILQIGINVAPVIGGDVFTTNIKNDLRFMNNLLGLTGKTNLNENDLKSKGFAISNPETIGVLGAEGDDYLHNMRSYNNDDSYRMATMQLTELLKELAPDEYAARQWGELQRVRMPDNSYRWLCKKHRDEVKR